MVLAAIDVVVVRHRVDVAHRGEEFVRRARTRSSRQSPNWLAKTGCKGSADSPRVDSGMIGVGVRVTVGVTARTNYNSIEHTTITQHTVHEQTSEHQSTACLIS